MSDIATISLRVDTSGLVAGNKALDDFQETATDAAKKADDLNSCFKAGAVSQKQSAASIKEQRQELQNLLNKISPVNRALNDLDDLQDKLRSAQRGGLLPHDDYTRYNQILETTRDKLGRVQQAETAEGRALLEAEAAAARATATRERFIQQLKNQVAAQTLSRTELLRQKAAQLGAGSAAEVYIKKLEQAGEQTHQLGLKSAGARREIGILIGELARGDLGALRGSGITLANRAGWIDQLLTLRGLSIAGVIGGITAAVYALGKAWYEGGKEGREFNKQLILTGDRAGKTAGQLSDLAKALSSSGLAQHATAANLAQVVGSGAFNVDQLETVTRAANAMQQATGQAVNETINNFKKLYDSPAKTSAELNSQLHYLTAEQFQYISALERRGDVEEAGEAAAGAYSQAEQKRSQQVLDNLGTIERFVRNVSNTWLGYWDAALGVGRKSSESEQLADIQGQIKRTLQLNGGRESEVADLREQERNLKFVIASQQGYANAQAKVNEINEKGITAQVTLNKYLDAGATAADKRRLATEQLTKAIEDNRKAAAAGTATLWTQGDIDKARAGIEKLYKDPATPKTKSPQAKQNTEDLSLQRQTLALQVQLDTLDKQQAIGGVISKQRRDLLTTESEISVLTEKSQKEGLNQQEQIRLAADKRTLSERETLATLGDQYEQKKKMLELDKQASKFHEQQLAKQAALDAQAAGKSNREAQRDAERSRIKDHYAGNPEAQAQALKDLEDTYKKEDDLRGNWLAGAESAWNEYYESAANVYSAVHDVAAAGFNGLSGMLDDLVTTGKTSFKSFAASMMKMIVQVIDQLLIAYALQKAMGWITGSVSTGGGSTPSGAYDTAAANLHLYSGGYTGDGGKYEPKGIVHGGEFVFTKEATSAIGVDNLYAMMKGAQGYANGGYVGKAPMAGLKGGSSAATVTPVISVSVGDINIGNEGQKNTGSAANAAAIGRQIKDAMVETINTQVRKPGTPLWNALRGR